MTEMRRIGSRPLQVSGSAVFTAAIILLVVAAIVLTADWPAAAKPVPLTACGIALTAATLNLVNELFGAEHRARGNMDGGVAADGHGPPAGMDSDKNLGPPAPAVLRQSFVYFLWLAGLLGLVIVTGMIPAIALFIFGYMHLGFGEPPGRAAVCGAVTALMCWALFDRLLAVAWPQSLLGDLFPVLRAALGFI
jgi:hypothetical protein